MIWRIAVYLLGVAVLPAAFFAIVLCRAAPIRQFWTTYWAEVALAAGKGA